MKELLEVLQPYLEPMLIALIGFIGYKLNEYLNAKISKDKQAEIENIVKASVLFVEQVYGIDMIVESQEKFDQAKSRALHILNSNKIEISEDYLDTLIEAFVFELTKEGK